eukprot:1187855-Prorocentrum_minimum.AAC.1
MAAHQVGNESCGVSKPCGCTHRADDHRVAPCLVAGGWVARRAAARHIYLVVHRARLVQKLPVQRPRHHVERACNPSGKHPWCQPNGFACLAALFSPAAVTRSRAEGAILRSKHGDERSRKQTRGMFLFELSSACGSDSGSLTWVD